MQQDKIGEHLNRPVGNVSIYKGICKGAVSEFEKNPAVRRILSFDIGNSRNTGLHFFKNGLENLRIILVEVFHYQLKIIPGCSKMFRFTQGIFGPAGTGYMKIRHVPVLNELTQCVCGLEFLELPQPLDCKNA